MQNETDKTTFLDLVRTHQNIVHKVSLVYSKTPADREDLRQEILLQLWKSWRSFDGRSEFSTWMYRVALNTAISFRRRQRSPEVTTENAWQRDDQFRAASLSENLELLYRGISRLSAVEKAVILQWLDERSYEEIADTIGISPNNVSVRLVRIRAKLARSIEEAMSQ
jgi:RNA polymerase sigma-70 factor (ECF subfamily)